MKEREFKNKLKSVKLWVFLFYTLLFAELLVFNKLDTNSYVVLTLSLMSLFFGTNAYGKSVNKQNNKKL